MLVTDSTAYVDAARAAELGIRVVPLHVSLGDWSFDEPDVTPSEFYARLAASDVRPTTSQPAPGEFLEAFTAAGGERVLCVTCSAALSGTFRSAELAATMSPVPVDVVDSGTMSGGLHLVVTAVARALADGTSYDAAVALARSMAGRVASTWSSDTTALLAAGGRLADDVPDGIAVLGLSGGVVSVLGSARTTEESVSLQAARVLAAVASWPSRVSVGHGDEPARGLADALAAELEGQPGVLGIDRYVVGPVAGAHAGPGAFGANYLVGEP